jgi:arsenite methyltransferase
MTDQLEKNIISPAWPPSGGAGSCRLDVTKKLSPGSPSDFREIRKVIRDKYAEVSISAEGKFQYPTGKDGAKALGYDPAIMENAHSQFFESSCGVGNPFSLGAIRLAATVLDFGCGGGFDLFVASKLVGENGRVCGIDLTEDMVVRATENLALAGITNFEIKKVDSEIIPYDDNSFDVVISNGVINLSPCKQTSFKEIYRVLKPGGRLQFADVVLEKDLPASLAGSAEAWSQWIGGAVPVRDQIRLLEEAGFKEVEWLGMTGFRTSQYTVGALFRANKTNWFTDMFLRISYSNKPLVELTPIVIFIAPQF